MAGEKLARSSGFRFILGFFLSRIRDQKPERRRSSGERAASFPEMNGCDIEIHKLKVEYF